MSRNIIQEIQNNEGIYHDGKSYRAPRNKLLLQETLPKYRRHFLQKSLEKLSKDRTSRKKDSHVDFGEEQFIKKLKINSTKQIDRKSAKAIQKYLQQMGQPKSVPSIHLPVVNSSLLISGSMERLNSINSYKLSSQFLSSPSHNNTLKKATSKQTIFNNPTANIKSKSNQIVNSHFSHYGDKKNQSESQIRLQDSILSMENVELQEQNHLQSDLNKFRQIQQTVKFKNQYVEGLGVNQRQGENQYKQYGMISFRDNAIDDGRGKSEKLQISKSRVGNTNKNTDTTSNCGPKPLLQRQNHFYYPKPQGNKPQQPQTKQRPTIDREKKLHERSTSNQPSESNSKSDSTLEQQISLLRQKNQQQSQIIRLQQIMIKKLNFQLQKITGHLEQKQNERNPSPKGLQRHLRINQNQLKYCRGIDNQIEYIDDGASVLQVNPSILSIFQDVIQQKTKKWQHDYLRLSNILSEMKFSSSVQSQTANNEMIGSLSEQGQNRDQQQKNSQNLERMGQQQEQLSQNYDQFDRMNDKMNYYQSSNQFYHANKYLSQQQAIQKSQQFKNDQTTCHLKQQLKESTYDA